MSRPNVHSNKPIIKALGGVLGRATSEAVKGRTDKLLSLLPYLMIVAKLATDPEGLETIMMLVNSVKSADDVWVWIEYLNLPTEGWLGDTPPPVNATASFEPHDYFHPLDWVISSAYAAPRIPRIPASKLKKLRKAVGNIDHLFANSEFGELIPAIRSLTKSMKGTDFASIRKLVHDPRALTTAVAAGGTGIRKLIRNTSNLRMSPLAMMAIITYLETRRGDCGDLPGCVPLRDEVSAKIPTLFGLAFVQTLTNQNRDFLVNYEIGAAFHLAMIAYHHLKYEITGQDEDEILRVEQPREIELYAKDGVGSIKQTGMKFTRRVDILLRGDSATDPPNADNTWVEVSRSNL